MFRILVPRVLLAATTLVMLAAISSTAWAIGGGTPDETGEYPYACAVLGLRDQGDPRIASGVLIHPRVVLTAGHVTDWFATIWDTEPEDVRITFDADATNTNAWLPVTDYCTNDLYNGFLGAQGLADPHDVGVIILRDAVTEIAPAELPVEGLLDQLKDAGLLQFGLVDGTPMKVVGYGRGLSFPPPAEAVEGYLRTRRYGTSTAMGMTPAFLHFFQDPDGVNTQRSDSGGPTFLEIDGQRILVATTSWAGSGSLTGIDHRYRIDTPDTLDFIYTVIAAVEAGLL